MEAREIRLSIFAIFIVQAGILSLFPFFYSTITYLTYLTLKYFREGFLCSPQVIPHAALAQISFRA